MFENFMKIIYGMLDKQMNKVKVNKDRLNGNADFKRCLRLGIKYLRMNAFYVLRTCLKAGNEETLGTILSGGHLHERLSRDNC